MSQGLTPFEATVEACKARLRPIIMTSFAFILGVAPLVVATGAGAEMRRTLGVAVFSGMLGVTAFGLLLTPVFYYVVERFVRGWQEDRLKSRPEHVRPAQTAQPPIVEPLPKG